MCSESHGVELAEMYTRSLEGSQTDVRPPSFFPHIESEQTTCCRGQLKIAEVSSRFENVDQFVSLISSVGFKFKSKVFT